MCRSIKVLRRAEGAPPSDQELHEAEPMSLLGFDRLAGQQEAHRLTIAHETRQHLRAAAAAHPAARHFRKADPGASPRDPDVSGERHLGATTENPAVQGGDDGLAQIAHCRRVFDAVAEFPGRRVCGEG